MPEFEIRDFSAGYIDGIDSNLIPPNAAKWAKNWLSKTAGKLEKRGGQEAKYPAHPSLSPIQGLYGYYRGLGLIERTLLVACGGQVGYWEGDPASFNPLLTELDTTAPMLFETCVNYMVGFNGVDDPWKWDGEAANTSLLANAPTDGRFPTLFKEKLFVVPKSDPSNLRWSDSFEPEQWPEVNYWPVGDGDGDEITCLRVFLDELVIFKNRSIHSLRGTSLDDFRLDKRDGHVGCVGPRAAFVWGTRIYFVGPDGLYTYNGMSPRNISEDLIPNFWSRINKEHLHKAVVGRSLDGFIWFALPVDGSTTNNIVLAYRFGQERGSFWPLTEIEMTDVVRYDTGSGLELYTGSPGGVIVNHNPKLFTDFGEPIVPVWQSFDMDADRAENEKKFKRAYLRLSPDVDPPDLHVSLDGGDYVKLEVERTDDLVSRHRFIEKRGRYLSLMFKHEGAGASELRGIYVPFKMKRKPKVRMVVESG